MASSSRRCAQSPVSAIANISNILPYLGSFGGHSVFSWVCQFLAEAVVVGSVLCGWQILSSTLVQLAWDCSSGVVYRSLHCVLPGACSVGVRIDDLHDGLACTAEPMF